MQGPGGRSAAPPATAGNKETLENVLPLLEDAVPGVRKAALSALTAVLENAGAALDSVRFGQILERVLDSGFAGDGSQARDAARVLARMDRDAAAERAVARMGALSTSAERRVAIEILKALYAGR